MKHFQHALQTRRLKLSKIQDYAIRLLAAVLFIAYIACQFVSVDHPRKNLFLPAVVNPTNAGYPFFKYYEPITPTHPVQPEKLDKFHSNDYGLQLLVCATYLIGHSVFGDGFKVSVETGLWIQLSMLVVTALLFLSPSFPLLISLLATGCLVLFLESSPYYFLMYSPDENKWCTGWACLLSTMFCLLVHFRQTKYLFWLDAAGLGLLISLLSFSRQDSQALLITPLLGFGFTNLITGRYAKNKSRFFLQVVFLCLIPIAVYSFVHFSVKEILAAEYKRKFTEQIVPHHGAGLNLYISLGFVKNNYNIGWKDDVADTTTSLVNNQAQAATYEENYQIMLRALSKEWSRIVILDPTLLLKNMLYKARFLHQFLWNPVITENNSELFLHLLHVQYWIKFIYILFLFTSACIIFVVCTKTYSPILPYFLTFLPTFAGAVSSTFIVMHGYPHAIIGALISFCFLFIPSILILQGHKVCLQWTKEDYRIIRQRLRKLLLFSGACVLPWVSIAQSRLYYLEKEVSSNPVQNYKKMGYRFSHFFNRLDKSQQEQVMRRLNEDPSLNSFKFSPSKSLPPMDYLSSGFVKAAFQTGKVLNVVVYLGKVFHPLSQAVNQGQVGSRLVIYKNDPSPIATYNFTDHLYFDLNNRFWADEYRMISLPIVPVNPSDLKFRIYQRQAREEIDPYKYGIIAAGELLLNTRHQPGQ